LKVLSHDVHQYFASAALDGVEGFPYVAPIEETELCAVAVDRMLSRPELAVDDTDDRTW
jgi:hypothetical protein